MSGLQLDIGGIMQAFQSGKRTALQREIFEEDKSQRDIINRRNRRLDRESSRRYRESLDQFDRTSDRADEQLRNRTNEFRTLSDQRDRTLDLREENQQFNQDRITNRDLAASVRGRFLGSSGGVVSLDDVLADPGDSALASEMANKSSFANAYAGEMKDVGFVKRGDRYFLEGTSLKTDKRVALSRDRSDDPDDRAFRRDLAASVRGRFLGSSGGVVSLDDVLADPGDSALASEMANKSSFANAYAGEMKDVGFVKRGDRYFLEGTSLKTDERVALSRDRSDDPDDPIRAFSRDEAQSLFEGMVNNTITRSGGRSLGEIPTRGFSRDEAQSLFEGMVNNTITRSGGRSLSEIRAFRGASTPEGFFDDEFLAGQPLEVQEVYRTIDPRKQQSPNPQKPIVTKVDVPGTSARKQKLIDKVESLKDDVAASRRGRSHTDAARRLDRAQTELNSFEDDLRAENKRLERFLSLDEERAANLAASTDATVLGQQGRWGSHSRLSEETRAEYQSRIDANNRALSVSPRTITAIGSPVVRRDFFEDERMLKIATGEMEVTDKEAAKAHADLTKKHTSQRERLDIATTLYASGSIGSGPKDYEAARNWVETGTWDQEYINTARGMFHTPTGEYVRTPEAENELYERELDLWYKSNRVEKSTQDLLKTAVANGAGMEKDDPKMPRMMSMLVNTPPMPFFNLRDPRQVAILSRRAARMDAAMQADNNTLINRIGQALNLTQENTLQSYTAVMVGSLLEVEDEEIPALFQDMKVGYGQRVSDQDATKIAIAAKTILTSQENNDEEVSDIHSLLIDIAHAYRNKK